LQPIDDLEPTRPWDELIADARRRGTTIRRVERAKRIVPAVLVTAAMVAGVLALTSDSPTKVDTRPTDRRPGIGATTTTMPGDVTSTTSPSRDAPTGGRDGGDGVGSSGDGSAGATTPAAWTGSQLALARDGGLVVLDPDGQLSSLGVAGYRPSWSPDGRRIAFSTVSSARSDELLTSKVKVLELATGAVSTLADGVDPVWSPDGTRLAYIHVQRNGPDPFPGARDWSRAIHVMDADGSNDIELAAYGFGPTWSPDGRFIAFATAYGNSNASTPTVVIVPSRGGAQTVVTAGASPAWSPDGRRLAIVLNERPPGSAFFTGPTEDANTGNDLPMRSLATVNVDGSDLRTLTDGTTDDADPSWSPDGSLIAFSRDGDANERTGAPSSIWLMRADGSGARQVTSGGDDRHPAFH
jgi:dipeptidyl aminopeptidase/acylaminoacyl peptidase